MRLCTFCLIAGLSMLSTAGCLRRQTNSQPSTGVARQWKSALHQAYRILETRQLEQLKAPLGAAREFARRYPAHRYAAKTAEYGALELLLRFQTTEATREYLRAKQLALAADDLETAAGSMHALSNIYLQAGNLGDAREAAEQALHILPARSKAGVRAGIQNHYARILSRSGRFAEAIRVFSEVIATAEREGLVELRANAWKLSSREYALLGDLDRAEHAIRESLRIRALTRDREMASDYHDLADIMIRAGRHLEAQAWLDRASARAAESVRFSAWRIDALRARAHLALGQPREALEKARRSVRALQESRTFLLPGDWLRSHSTPSDNPHGLLVDAALAEFARTGNPLLLSEAFAASEARRALSLRAAARNTAIPPAQAARYWRTAAELDAAYTELMDSPPGSAAASSAQAKLTQSRLALAEIEASFDTAITKASAGLATPSPAQLKPDEAFIAFQLGETGSYAWTLARTGLSVTRLPSQARIEAEHQALMSDVSATPRAALLCRTLFGELPPAARRARSWLLAVEGPLFETPFAALVTGHAAGRPTFLIEDHSLQLVPGSWALERRRPARQAGLFLGVGDPVYNQADPRRRDSAWRLFQAQASSAPELARLAGSGAEVEQCAKEWPASRILSGPEATPDQFSTALSDSPYAAIHLAVHVVPAPDAPRENLIALSLAPAGRPSYVGPEWIGARRIDQSLVVMNGCRSGSGAVTGEGLLGLSRAWLRAGATRVLSTLWPTNDNGGAFAREFYRRFRRDRLTHAEALRQTQLTMAASTDWRADPRHWAAYFLTGYPE